MSFVEDPDGQIERWLRGRLDAVPEPRRAVDEAIRMSATLAQRKPRRGLRALLRARRAPGTGRSEPAEPETVIWADTASASDPDAAVAAPSPRPQQMPLAAAAIALGIAVFMALGFLVAGLGSPQGQLAAPGVDGVRPAALVLVDPLPAGREIIVAADGSGHFWTIGDAVSQAVDGDRIVIRPGDYQASVVVTQDITITGDGGPDDVIVRPHDSLTPDDRASLVDYVPVGGDPALGEQLPSDWRYVFHLLDSDVRLSAMTILGSEVGSAIVVDGGAPVLDDLVIDPDGDQHRASPGEPHEAVVFRRQTRASLQNSAATALVSVTGASAPTISNNVLSGTCLAIEGAGSNATVIGNRIEGSLCSRFSVLVRLGASPTIESNDIIGDRVTDGIRIVGPDSAPTVVGNNVSGGDSGIWIGGDAEGLISRNNVVGARTGISIIGAGPTVSTNGFFDNEVGASIDAMASPQFIDNELCRNTLDVKRLEGATFDLEGNDICTRTSEEDAVST